MWYVVFGDGTVWECTTQKQVLDRLTDDAVEFGEDFWQAGDVDELRGNSEAFTVIKGDLLNVDRVWQVAKEEK